MTEQKVVKVYFCPSCRSKRVGYTFGFRNFFGIIPQMKCKDCGFTGMTFPILAVHEKHLKEANAKVTKHKKKRKLVIRHSQERK